jgi:hypothetical protein
MDIMTDTYETRDLSQSTATFRSAPAAVPTEGDAALLARLMGTARKSVLPDTAPSNGADNASAAVTLDPTGTYAGNPSMNGAVVRVPVTPVFPPSDDVADIADATTGAVDRPLVDDSGIPAGEPEFEGDSPKTDEELR